MRYILLASLVASLLVALPVQAQSGPPVWNPAVKNGIGWTQPTQNVDGSAVVVGELTANTVYRGTKADGSDLTLLIVIKPAATSYNDNSVGAGTWCYAVSATGTFVVNGSNVSTESAKSGVVCKTSVAPPPPAPGPPANPITVASTAYTIIKVANGLVALPVGTVPAGTVCDPKQGAICNGVPYYAVPVSAVSWSGNVRPPIVVATCTS